MHGPRGSKNLDLSFDFCRGCGYTAAADLTTILVSVGHKRNADLSTYTTHVALLVSWKYANGLKLISSMPMADQRLGAAMDVLSTQEDVGGVHMDPHA